MNYCEKCGAKNENGSDFCEYCGASLNHEDASVDKGSKVMTGIIIVLVVVLLCVGIGIIRYVGSVLSVESAVEQEEERSRSKKDSALDDKREDKKTDRKDSKEDSKEVKPEDADQQETKGENLEEETRVEEEWKEIESDSYDTLSSLNVENEVARIRSVYNEIQANAGNYYVQYLTTSTCYTSPDGVYKKYIVSQNANGINYEQWYFTENEQLIFAFYYRGQTEERFYFYQGQMFRWIDTNKITRDKEFNNADWINWENTVKSAWQIL